MEGFDELMCPRNHRLIVGVVATVVIIVVVVVGPYDDVVQVVQDFGSVVLWLDSSALLTGAAAVSDLRKLARSNGVMMPSTDKALSQQSLGWYK